jgi:hypothetical protein
MKSRPTLPTLSSAQTISGRLLSQNLADLAALLTKTIKEYEELSSLPEGQPQGEPVKLRSPSPQLHPQVRRQSRRGTAGYGTGSRNRP